MPLHEFRTLTHHNTQILSVTCNNASCNDTMIDALADDLPDFSQANRTRCFLHIVNLIEKTLLKQFDVPGKQAEDVANEAERLLLKLAKDIDIEEMMTRLDTANKSEGD